MALRLHVLDASAAGGGVCLDGTPPAYYYAPGSDSGSRSWLIFLKGGGWCMDEFACRHRSEGLEGGTSKLKATQQLGGMLSSDPLVNPTFAHFHRAYLWYCDGSMFTSDREAPLVVGNSTVWLRGRRVLSALLRALLGKGLGDATQVLLAGHSAGGLAATIHADAVSAMLPPSARLKAVSVSGFFLLHPGGHEVSGGGVRDRIWLRAMRGAFELHEARSGVASNCVGARAAGDAWRCFFANESVVTTTTPLFLLGSSLDSWQMANVWRADQTCTRSCFAHRSCATADVRDRLEAFSRAFVRDLSRAGGWLHRRGNGAFVHTCCEHDAYKSDAAWSTYAVGGVTMREAVQRWWEAPRDATPAAHTQLPCELRAVPPHSAEPGGRRRRLASHDGLQCNPSCAAFARASGSTSVRVARFTPRVAATEPERAMVRRCRSHYVCKAPPPLPD